MQGTFYKIPIEFGKIFQKQELPKSSIEDSIAHYINLVATSSFGECKFDESFGCNFWETDFDLLVDYSALKNKIAQDLSDSIKLHETRLKLTEVVVQIREGSIDSPSASVRMKKKVYIQIKGFIIKTDRPFQFQGFFYLGPLSYL